MFNHERLVCYRLSMELAKKMPCLTNRWPRGYYYLSDQLKRALSSIVLNIAEGNGRQSLVERKRFFTISQASANEVASIIEIAHAYDLIDKPNFEFFRCNLLQVVKILYKLK